VSGIVVGAGTELRRRRRL